MHVLKPISAVFAISVLAGLSACQSTLLSDDRIVSNTAGVLGVSPADLTIANRRSDGATNTYYTATARSGRAYACTINGGGVLAMGLVNPPTCNPIKP